MRDGVRPATAADEDAIVRLVRGARLNPRGLRWDRFVVAERDGGIVGVAQIRRHPDGSRELASLVVVAPHRDRGTAAAMVDALLAREPSPVYTLVDGRYADHFARWGFTPIPPAALPPSIRAGSG